MKQRGVVSRCENSDYTELLRRLRTGDQAALAALLDRHRAALLGRVRRRLPHRLRSKVDPEDVLGDVHVVVCRKSVDFRGTSEAEFVAWLVKITDFKLRETARRYLDTDRRNARRERPPGTRPNDSRIPGLGNTPSEEAMGAELVAKAHRAFARLPPDYVEVLTLARVEGTDLREVATQMDRSYEATKKLHARAMELYRRHLTEGEST